MYPSSTSTQPYIPLQGGITTDCHPTIQEVNKRAKNVEEKHTQGSIKEKDHLRIYPYGSDPLTSETTMGNIMMTQEGSNVTYGNNILAFPTLNGLFYNEELPGGGLQLNVLGVAKTNHHAGKIGDQSGCTVIIHGTTIVHWNPITAHQRIDKSGEVWKTPAPPRFDAGQMVAVRYPHPDEIQHRKERGDRRVFPDIVPFSWGERHELLTKYAYLNNNILQKMSLRNKLSIQKQVETIDPKNNDPSNRNVKVQGDMTNVVAASLKLCSITSFVHGIEILMRRGILKLGEKANLLNDELLSSKDIPSDESNMTEFRRFLDILNFFEHHQSLTPNQIENAIQLQSDIYCGLSWPHLHGFDNKTYTPKLYHQNVMKAHEKTETSTYKKIVQNSSNYFFKLHSESLKSESKSMLGVVLEPVNPNNGSAVRVPIFLTKSNTTGYF